MVGGRRGAGGGAGGGKQKDATTKWYPILQKMQEKACEDCGVPDIQARRQPPPYPALPYPTLLRAGAGAP